MNDEFLDFYKRVTAKRRNTESTATFVSELIKDPIFIKIVDEIEKRTVDWGIKSGLTGKKKEDDSIAPELAPWRDFFRDHSFQSTEDARNFVDALSILTKTDLNKFMPSSKPARRQFPSYISIVPIRQTNGHNYKIGAPILTFGSGLTFFKLTGEPGNQMSTAITDYRLADREEIINLAAHIMLRVDSSVENFVYMLDSSQ